MPRTFAGQDGPAGVHVLRTLDDALALRAEPMTSTRVEVVGDGVLAAGSGPAERTCHGGAGHRRGAARRRGRGGVRCRSGDGLARGQRPRGRQRSGGWTDQFDVKIHVHGVLSADAEVTVVDGDMAQGRFVARYRGTARARLAHAQADPTVRQEIVDAFTS
ncbi:MULTISPECIES: hypothetical protein [Streptomyces]|uniref:hypothetical protein n=1 Tax=Streptomyces TaxID=1883 RepID=UPI001AD7EF64